MADPVNLDLICDEFGVSRQEALYYLEGFEWDLVLAMEACRHKHLPPLKAKSSPVVSIFEKSSDKPESSGSPEVINPHLVLNQNPQEEEITSQRKKQLIDSFREVAIGMPLQDVINFLDRFNWDVNVAVNYYMDQRYSSPEMLMNSQHSSDQAIDQLMRFSQGESSAHMPTDYSNKGEIGSSSSSLMNLDLAETRDELKEATPQVKIQESSSSTQITEEPLPPFKVDQICNEIGVSREDALFYLEGFEWNSTLAMEACRSKTLPPAKVKSSTGVSVNEKSAAHDLKSRSTPVVINSRGISTEKQIQTESLQPQEKEKIIVEFCSVAVGASREEAIAYLDRCRWTLNDAIVHFMDKRSETLHFQRMSEYDHSMMGQSSSQSPCSSENVTSKSLAPERLQNIYPPVSLVGLHSQSQLQASGSSSSSLMNIDPTETETSLKEVDDVSITIAIPPMTTSQVDIQGSSSPAQIREEPLQPLRKTLPRITIKYSPSTPMVINSCHSSNESQSQREELLPQRKEKKITEFCSVAIASRVDAIAYLNRCRWDLGEAIIQFMDMGSGNLNSQSMSEYDHSMMGQSSSQRPCSSEVPSKSLAPERLQNIYPPVPLMDLQSQSQLQASGSSSSGLMNIDPTETDKSLKEGGDASVTVAIPPMKTSEVDRKLRGKAVEENSSTEAAQAVPNTTTIEITFHDGTVVEIPFRLDQTIRNIRNAIEELRPDDSRDYYFMSKTGEDYKDLDTTVRKMSKSSTSLMQIYPA